MLNNLGTYELLVIWGVLCYLVVMGAVVVAVFVILLRRKKG
jgi:hypothetical protein